jgi:hypothetical protein
MYDAHLLAGDGACPPAGLSRVDRDGHARWVRLSRQGGALVRYVARSGCLIQLYTSMTGIVGYPCPPYTPPANQIMEDDPDGRYRVLRVEGHGATGTPYAVADADRRPALDDGLQRRGEEPPATGSWTGPPIPPRRSAWTRAGRSVADHLR